jgi:hypothetical protein
LKMFSVCFCLQLFYPGKFYFRSSLTIQIDKFAGAAYRRI